MVRPEGFWNSWLGATARIMDVASGIQALGWDVSLLVAKPQRRNYDAEQQAAFPGNIIRTPFSGSYSALMDIHPWLRRIIHTVWRLKGESYFNEKYESGWSSRLIEWYRDRNLPAPDIIWAISTGNLSSLLGGYELAVYLDKPLILEIHDPIASLDRKGLPPSLENSLKNCYRRSSTIITTTQSFADWLEVNYKECKGKTEAVHLSFDEGIKQAPASRKDSDLILLHAGALYTGSMRNARSLVRSLPLVFKKEPSARRHIKIRLLGSGAGGRDAARIADELNLSSVVQVLPECSPQEALAEMSNADVLVLIKFADAEYNMQIPGKLFQYLGQGKPILGIVPESEAATILQTSGVGFNAANEDIEGIADHIINFWQNRNNLSGICQPNVDFIKQFSKSEMAGRINHILLDVIG